MSKEAPSSGWVGIPLGVHTRAHSSEETPELGSVTAFPLCELRKTLGKSVDNWLDYACLCVHLCRGIKRESVPP